MEKKIDIIKALEFLDNDYLLNASVIEPIRTGTVEILYASSECVYVKDKLTDVYMIVANDLELADELLNDYDARYPLVAHGDALCELAVNKLGFDSNVPCYQAVYRKERFPDVLGEPTMRLMREDEAKEAANMYHFDEESALKHIRRKMIYGAYSGDEIVGMIGMHMQGSMGLLEVKEKFRRRGYAEKMEKFLINKLLFKGLVPYCQVIEDNQASLALQRKLGLEISENKLYWLHKEN